MLPRSVFSDNVQLEVDRVVRAWLPLENVVVAARFVRLKSSFRGKLC